MDDSQESGLPWVYQIKVLGRLSQRWSNWLNDLNIACETEADSGTPVIILTGQVADQAALRSLLNRIWDLNLTIISLTRLQRSEPDEGAGASRRPVDAAADLS